MTNNLAFAQNTIANMYIVLDCMHENLKCENMNNGKRRRQNDVDRY